MTIQVERFREKILVALALLVLLAPVWGCAHELTSPDGKIRVHLTVGDLDGKAGVPTYRVERLGLSLIRNSALGLQLRGSDLTSGFAIHSVSEREVRESFLLPFGKASRVSEVFREYTIALEQTAASHLQLQVIFRIFDDGVAFRYFVPKRTALADWVLEKEATRFNPDRDPKLVFLSTGFGSAYEVKYRSGNYEDLAAGAILAMPFVARFPGGYLQITEADLHDYANAYLSPSPDRQGFSVEMPPAAGSDPAPVRGSFPFRSPWRVLMIGDSPRAVLESNILASLNPPSRIEDPSWIQPGKILFQWWNGYVLPGLSFDPPAAVLNEETLKNYVDFCAKNSIPYFSIDGYEFDKAWYGGRVAPFDPQTQDLSRSAPEVDVPAVIAYANTRGVKVRLWVNGAGLTAENIDSVFSTFRKWGASGVMADFMGDDTQRGVAKLDQILETAARYHLTVAFHGVAKPTGLTRTYPNLLTEEGVLGQEYNKWEGPNSTPDHEVNVGIIRGSVGPMDTHQGSFRPVPPAQFHPHSIAPNSMGTLAHQLATYVAYENEQPMLADYPAAYEKHPDAFRFLQKIPVFWDQSEYLVADLDEQRLTVARRYGKEWYVGTLNGNFAGRYSVSFGFLGPGTFVAEILGDPPESDPDGEALSRETTRVTSRSRLKIELSVGGGQVVRIRPSSTSER